MSENIEEQFNRIMKEQGLEKLTKKPKEVYIARFRLTGEEETNLVEEFATKKEFEDWYEAVGRATEEAYGGKIELNFGPSELGQLEDEP